MTNVGYTNETAKGNYETYVSQASGAQYIADFRCILRE